VREQRRAGEAGGNTARRHRQPFARGQRLRRSDDGVRIRGRDSRPQRLDRGARIAGDARHEVDLAADRVAGARDGVDLAIPSVNASTAATLKPRSRRRIAAAYFRSPARVSMRAG